VLVSLVLSLLFGQILSWHYRRYSPVLSHKRKFARMFVFLVTTTMLVISVVKTSLALSLGLVGALSIIRFRTPIKEPEDLAYLFLAVAVGIGLGADQRVVTTVVVTALLVYISLARSGSTGAIPPRLLVHVTSTLGGPDGAPANAEEATRALLAEAEAAASQVDVRRVDVHGLEYNANLILDLHDPRSVGALVHRLQTVLPSSAVSVVEGYTLD
jgi:hypothetical protein